MTLSSEFQPLELDDLRREAAALKADGWRFVQTHAVTADEGIDLYYSFMKDGNLVNYRIESVQKGTPVPSITDLFLAAFVFENEARELFGVNMRDIALDFQGAMYDPAEPEPMTFITPEQKAARERARKAANKAAEEAAAPKDSQLSNAGTGRRIFVMTPELQARLDAKMPSLSNDKKAKVEAALKARAEEAAGAATAQDKSADKKDAEVDKKPAVAEMEKPTDAQLEVKLASLSPEKAAKVRAALSKKDSSYAAPAASASFAEPTTVTDSQVDQLVSLMDDAKAAKVRAALAAKGGE